MVLKQQILALCLLAYSCSIVMQTDQRIRGLMSLRNKMEDIRPYATYPFITRFKTLKKDQLSLLTLFQPLLSYSQIMVFLMNHNRSVLNHVTRMHRTPSHSQFKPFWLISALDKENKQLNAHIQHSSNPHALRLLQIQNQHLQETVKAQYEELSAMRDMLMKVQNHGFQALWEDFLRQKSKLIQAHSKIRQLEAEVVKEREKCSKLSLKSQAREIEMTRKQLHQNQVESQNKLRQQLKASQEAVALLKDVNKSCEYELKESKEQIDVLNNKLVELNESIEQSKKGTIKSMLELNTSMLRESFIKPIMREIKPKMRDASTGTEINFKRTIVLRKQNIKDIRLLLLANLLNNYLDLNTMEQFLSDTLSLQPHCSQIQKMLCHPPFSLPLETAIKFTDYLIEQKSELPLPMLKSIMRSLLGPFSSISQEERTILRQQMEVIVKKWKNSLFYRESVEVENLQEVGELIDEKISEKMQNYIFMEHFNRTAILTPIRLAALTD